MPDNAQERRGSQPHKSTTLGGRTTIVRLESTTSRPKKPASPLTCSSVCFLLITYPQLYYLTLGKPTRLFRGVLPPKTIFPSLFWTKSWWSKPLEVCSQQIVNAMA